MKPRSITLPPSVIFIADDVFDGFSAIALSSAKGSCAENHAAAHANVLFREQADL